jgi:hypothetical protein
MDTKPVLVFYKGKKHIVHVAFNDPSTPYEKLQEKALMMLKQKEEQKIKENNERALWNLAYYFNIDIEELREFLNN